MTQGNAPIRSWGTTTYRRLDYDSRRPTGGFRWGRWHAFQDSNPWADNNAPAPGSVTRLALCNRAVDISPSAGNQWLNQPDPPERPRRQVCQDCLRLWSDAIR